MSKVFGASSTTDEVLAGVDLRGKRMVVTGVSAGLGIETARALAAHGAHVVGTARDLAKAEAATAGVRQAAAAHGGAFELVELDLAPLQSVGRCAPTLLRDESPRALCADQSPGAAHPPRGTRRHALVRRPSHRQC